MIAEAYDPEFIEQQKAEKLQGSLFDFWVAVNKAGVSLASFSPEHLKRMTALELIGFMAQNKIQFVFNPS